MSIRNIRYLKINNTNKRESKFFGQKSNISEMIEFMVYLNKNPLVYYELRFSEDLR